MKTEIKEIEVVPYNPDWPKLFETEAKAIRSILGNNCIAIHHVGSTAVTGLSAKPKIDIIAAFKNPTKSIPALESIAYEYRGEWNIPFKFGFRKRGKIGVNLHVFEEENPEIDLNIFFRDYLRAHPETQKEYVDLKRQLLTQQESYEKKNAYATGYNLGKDDFIRKILEKSECNRLRMHYCVHYEELSKAEEFRQSYFLRKNTEDPYPSTFNDADHVHLILYQGVNIIGYAHIQLWPDNQAAFRMMVIDENVRSNALEGQFLSLLEKWLKSKGVKVKIRAH